jgi:hypothetical protein
MAGVMVEPQARAANGLRELYDGHESIVSFKGGCGRPTGECNAFHGGFRNGTGLGRRAGLV